MELFDIAVVVIAFLVFGFLMLNIRRIIVFFVSLVVLNNIVLLLFGSVPEALGIVIIVVSAIISLRMPVFSSSGKLSYEPSGNYDSTSSYNSRTKDEYWAEQAREAQLKLQAEQAAADARARAAQAQRDEMARQQQAARDAMARMR